MTTFYELLTLIPGTLTDEEAQVVSDSIRQRLEQHGAAVGKHQIWEKRKLAYPVDHVRQGVYIVSEFDLAAEKLNALERDLQLDKALLRHQIVKAYRKTAEDLEREARHAASERVAERKAVEPVKPTAETRKISKEELDEKLAEILTDDIVK